MYESYWQLQEKPFASGCDPRFYFPAESHQASLLKLRYAIENRCGGAVLAAASGVGKTLLVEVLRKSLAPHLAPFVHLVYPQMATDQLLAYLARELTPSVPLSLSMTVRQSVAHIGRFLSKNAKRGQHAVVAVDEAHLLQSRRTLEALRLLLNFETAGHPSLTLLLVGQPAILPLLDRTPQLEERLGVKCLLRPLAEAETSAYVAHRLAQAGSQQTIFEPDGLSALQRLTHGIPRRINRLCDLALLIGFAEQHPTLSAAQIEAVSHELVAAAA